MTTTHGSTANLPRVVGRDEWTAARVQLLEREKELTRLRDALVADRRRLPMVEVTKEYLFHGEALERPGRSSFLRVGNRVYHTCSIYARGLETIGGSYYMLDGTALGRQEDWEEPRGRARAVRGAVPDFAT